MAERSAARARPFTSRTLHRWLGLGAALLFAAVATTGVLLQLEQLFGEEETQKETLARLTSPVDLGNDLTVDDAALARARRSLLASFGNRPVDSIDWQIKGPAQQFVFHLGGASPIKAMVDVPSGRLLSSEPDEEEWLLRLHTGEILGDGGKVLGLFWGLALLAMLVTGSIVYVQLYRARQRAGKARGGLRRYFWRPGP
ncbi:MAG TPA: PepSY-associated TM helix domain-containing protein [Sphingomicrobium sp.]|nr:PepSY-associated TM helix domain-containing protein [Sphingomicrobium sp.]